MQSVLKSNFFLAAVVAALAAASSAASAQPIVYKCPPEVGSGSKTPLYTDSNALSAKIAAERGCKTIDNAPITVMETVKPRRPAATTTAGASSGARVDPTEQRARDSDSRRILEDELAREQSRLDASLKEYNNGQPERLGDERNYQKYLDRTADLKASIERRQSDIEAIRRELAKLPQ